MSEEAFQGATMRVTETFMKRMLTGAALWPDT
jgi:hypothetical protein